MLSFYPPAVLSSIPYTEKVSGKELTERIVHSDTILYDFLKVGRDT